MTGESEELAITARGLRRSYGTTEAVRGLDLSVRQGELFGLIGPDGAGKTTTISCIAGLIAPSAGTVRLLGEDPLAKRSSVRDRLGLMPQQYSLYGDLSVAENLRFFARLFGLSRTAYRVRAERLLAITRLERFTERRADALSGGMYKKLALACALLHTPRVLLMDEPTNGVDPVSRRELWELIYELLGEGMAVLVSTPYMDEAARCHRVAMLDAGRVVSEGTPERLVQDLPFLIFELTCSQKSQLHARLATLPFVVSASPAGARVRVVIAPEERGRLTNALHGLSVEMRQVAPDFEDLFLAHSAERSGS